MMQRLRQWWQMQTGHEETPFDGDFPAWVVSLGFHLLVLVAISMLTRFVPSIPPALTITTSDEQPDTPDLPQEFHFQNEVTEEIGANSEAGFEAAFAMAPEMSDFSEVAALAPTDIIMPEATQVETTEIVEASVGPHVSANQAVKGVAGYGTTGASGAIDRITHEILTSLGERKTLVVWLFDQSGSLQQRRKEIVDRFDRIYEQLGVIEASGNEAFAKHKDRPLLTSVLAFGDQVTLRTKKPTDDIQEIKSAVEGIELDSTGVERSFSALYMAAKRYQKYRMTSSSSGSPERNVMLIAVTDEAGDDADGLDQTVSLCRRYAMPVYVIGVPAPFGRKETVVKWIDPNPEFDQSAQWGRVDQGPESLVPERIRLHFSGTREDTAPIDSGFGPFALTRLCYETGGIYFAVHPNRQLKRRVGRHETAPYAAHIRQFFDSEKMLAYRPDYVSAREYKRRLMTNPTRMALVNAAKQSWITPMDSPQTTFVKNSEAALASALTEAQKSAAKLEPRVHSLYEILKQGEPNRTKEATPRWQAGYDLAMGRVLAVKVRTESYNAMLAAAKRGLEFKDPKNNTWNLVPSDDLSVGSQLKSLAKRGRTYLEQVVDEHPETPWAELASRELQQPLGWKWQESFTDLNPQQNNAGNNNNNVPQDDQARMLNRPKKRRPLPKL